MKKIITSIWILCMGFLCLGCFGKSPDVTIPPTVAPTTEPPVQETTAPTAPYVQYDIPFTAVSCAALTMDFTNDTGALALRYTCQNLELTLQDPQVANTVLVDYLNRVDHEGSTVQKVLSDALRAMESDTDFQPYSISVLYSPQRLDSEVLSLYGTQIIDKDGIRPAVNQLSCSYDMITGRLLALKDVLVHDFSADDLAALIVDALADRSAEGILYSDYAYVITQMFSTNTPVNTWYFSGTGLCFYFPPYEIAPYSEGTIVAEIPYSLLPGLLKDSYFPTESEVLSGTVTAVPFSQAQLSSISQFSEVILDSTAPEYLLTALGGVRNVRLETGVWNPDGTFIPTYTVFAAAALTDNDGIRLQAADPAALRITYETEDGIVTLNISQLIS